MDCGGEPLGCILSIPASDINADKSKVSGGESLDKMKIKVIGTS